MHIVIFHSAVGLTPGVLTLARSLREDGHDVLTPDLYEGRTFATTAEGALHRDAIGIPTLIERGMAAIGHLPAKVVYVGFSMGAALAAFSAGAKPGALGVALLHGAVPLALLGLEAWPATPVLVQTSPGDALVNPEDVESFVQEVTRSGASCTHHVYPGTGHLFTDESAPEYSAQDATLAFDRVRAFARTLGG